MNRAAPTEVRRRSPADAWFALSLGLVGVAYLVLFSEQLRSGLEFDESYNLSVAMNLAEGHGYAAQGAAHGELRTPFDPLVSTGPTLLLPTSLMWALGNGFGPLVRLPALAFFALYVVGAYVCGRRLGGRWAGLAAAMAPLLVPAGVPDLGTYSLVPGRVVGEFTACALLVWAALLLPSRRGASVFLGGLCAGLVFETKTSFVFAVALVGAGWLAAELLTSRFRLRRGLLAASGVLLPIASWEAYRGAVLGVQGLRENTAELRAFAGGQNARQDLQAAAGRLRDLADVFTDGRLAVLGVVLVAGAAGLGVLLRGARRREHDVVELATIGLLGASGLLLGVVWIGFSAQPSARQGMPTLMLCLPLAFALSAVALTSATSARPRVGGVSLAQVGVGTLGAGLAVAAVVSTWGTTWHTELLQEQEAAADVIARSGTPSIMSNGWFMHVEYQLLTGLPPDRAPTSPPATVLVSTPVEGAYRPGSRDVASPDVCPGRELYRSWAAVVCATP